MTIIIKQAETDNEYKQYYNLRWRILRKPWGQPEGSEIDELEDDCVHVIAKDDNTVVGIGRLQINSTTEAQIRYMAVEEKYEAQGVGKKIVEALEQRARQQQRYSMMLDAREPAVGFYEKLGYAVTKQSYLLFGSIQHYTMTKQL